MYLNILDGEEKTMSKASKEITHKNIKFKEDYNIFKWILLIGLLFVMFYTPYLRGLYFESEQLVTEIILLSIFILFWIYKWLKKDRTFIKTPIEFAALGLVLVYLLSSFTAVSQRLAVAEFLKYVMYFIVFYILSDLIKGEKEKKYLLWTIVASALGVCIIGIDSTADGKIVGMFNAVFKALRMDFSFFGLFVNGRIHSTMQYPNALASYLMAAFFISISLALTSRKWLKSLASSLSFVLLVTFVFTISRGAYILLVFAVPLFLLLLPKGSRAIGVYCLSTVIIITGAFSFFLLRFITDASGDKSLIWPFVLAGALISFLVRFTDDIAIRIINKINLKVTVIGSTVFVILITVVLVYIFNASVPLELRHTMDEKDEYIGKTKIVELESNKKYKLVFDVNAKSENEKAEFAYRIYIKTRNETGISSGDEVLILDERYDVTNGVEEMKIEFEVPQNNEMVNIAFQNYYAGTSVIFYEAKIYEADSGSEIKKIVLNHKYPFAESILARFENLTADQSFNNRIIFMKDGLKIFKDWWLIGAGGGSWSLLNFKYQSYLYWSTQTHNYPLQVLVETGLFGMINLLLLLVFIFVGFIKVMKNSLKNTNEDIYNITVFTATMLLFFHSVMDFDFSLSSIYLLAWQLIAVLNSDIRKYLLIAEDNIQKSKRRKKDYKFSTKSLKNCFSKGLNVYPLVMIILTFVFMIWPIIFIRAQAYANDALERYKQNDLDGAIKLMESAAELDYLNAEYVIGYTPISSKPDIRLGFIDLLIKKIEMASNKTNQSTEVGEQSVLNSYIVKAKELAKKAEKHAKNNADISLNLGVYYLKTTEKEKGIDYINKSVELKPLFPGQWQYKANVLYATASNYFQQGESQKGLEYVDDMLGIIDEAKKVNEYNLSPFIFNEETQKFLEKAYYIKNEIKENQVNVDNIVFQSVSGMDVNSDNILDQWTISDKSIVDSYIKNGVFTVSNKDKSQEPCIYTRKLEYEINSKYRIEVELENYEEIKSIPYRVVGATETEQLVLNNNVFVSEFSGSNPGENMRLYIYIKDKYNIKNVKLLKIS